MYRGDEARVASCDGDTGAVMPKLPPPPLVGDDAAEEPDAAPRRRPVALGARRWLFWIQLLLSNKLRDAVGVDGLEGPAAGNFCSELLALTGELRDGCGAESVCDCR